MGRKSRELYILPQHWYHHEIQYHPTAVGIEPQHGHSLLEFRMPSRNRSWVTLNFRLDVGFTARLQAWPSYESWFMVFQWSQWTEPFSSMLRNGYQSRQEASLRKMTCRQLQDSLREWWQKQNTSRELLSDNLEHAEKAALRRACDSLLVATGLTHSRRSHVFRCDSKLVNSFRNCLLVELVLHNCHPFPSFVIKWYVSYSTAVLRDSAIVWLRRFYVVNNVGRRFQREAAETSRTR